MSESSYELIISFIHPLSKQRTKNSFKYFSFSEMGLMRGLAALCLVAGHVTGFQPAILVSTGTAHIVAVAATEETNKRAR